jgi:hypothetical protein
LGPQIKAPLFWLAHATFILRLIVILWQNERLPHNPPHAHLIHTQKMHGPEHASQAKLNTISLECPQLQGA